MPHLSSQSNLSIDPKSGFCSKSMVYYSLRPEAPLPPETTTISVNDYAFSLLKAHPPPPTTAALIDASSGHRILHSELFRRIDSLAAALHYRFGLSKGDSALILSPNSPQILILYFSLLSLGVIVSPSNPASSNPEISRQIELSDPAIAFATSETAHKIPYLRYGTILLDSAEFESLMMSQTQTENSVRVTVSQSDPAAILYSSGTTGRVKGVVLTHRNFIAHVAGGQAMAAAVRETPAVALCPVPYFHVYGFAYCVREVAMGKTLVCMGRFDLGVMGRAIQEFKVSHVAVAPPVVLAMVRDEGVMDGYDLSSLEVVGCGGAALQKSVIEKFVMRFPKVQLSQAYGLTETTGRVFSSVGRRESQKVGATGKLSSNCQAKIVDPLTGTCLPPSNPGELCLKGPLIMKGYIGDEEATATILDSEGWLRTGDLCYIDNEGFLFFIDRIKELIKYKGYQVPPAELEHLLLSHSDIVDATVVPYPDDEAGQVPVAFIVRRSRSKIDESQIKDFIAKQVAPYKRIRRVMFVNSIPKNGPGKVLRRELIKLAASNTQSKL